MIRRMDHMEKFGRSGGLRFIASGVDGQRQQAKSNIWTERFPFPSNQKKTNVENETGYTIYTELCRVPMETADLQGTTQRTEARCDPDCGRQRKTDPPIRICLMRLNMIEGGARSRTQQNNTQC